MWNVLTTEPNRELSVLAFLIGLRFTCYTPTHRANVRMPYAPRGGLPRQKQNRFVDRALFPRYVFLRAEAEPRWNVLRSIPGLRGWLRNGDAPAIVSDAAVLVVRAAETAANDTRSRRRPFGVGDRVRVAGHRHDVFSGVQGLLAALDRRDRATLELMAGVRIIVAASRLEAAE